MKSSSRPGTEARLYPCVWKGGKGWPLESRTLEALSKRWAPSGALRGPIATGGYGTVAWVMRFCMHCLGQASVRGERVDDGVVCV